MTRHYPALTPDGADRSPDGWSIVVDTQGCICAHDSAAAQALGIDLETAHLGQVLACLGVLPGTGLLLMQAIWHCCVGGGVRQLTLPLIPSPKRVVSNCACTVVPRIDSPSSQFQKDGQVTLVFTPTPQHGRPRKALFRRGSARTERRFAGEVVKSWSSSTLPVQDAFGEQAQWLFGILDQLPVGVTVYDDSETAVFVNECGRQLIGLPEGPAALSLHIDIADRSGAALSKDRLPSSRARRGETVRDEEYQFTTLAGKQVPIRVSAARVEAGSWGTYVTVAYSDISSYEAIARLRDDYLHALSHDLRSPLTVISVAAQLIKSTGGAEPINRMADQIAAAATTMEQMIDHLMHAAMLESGHYRPTLATVELGSLVRSCVGRAAVISNGRLRLDPGPEPLHVSLDQSAFEQVVDNLISNAVKYSPASQPVTISWRSSGGGAIISVADSGPGVPSEQVPLIFSRFYRYNADGAERCGLGLGLHISRLLVEAHGGTLWVGNRPEGGAVFSFSLPL